MGVPAWGSGHRRGFAVAFVCVCVCVCARALYSVLCVHCRLLPTSPVLQSICSRVRVSFFCPSVLVVTKVSVCARARVCVRAGGRQPSLASSLPPSTSRSRVHEAALVTCPWHTGTALDPTPLTTPLSLSEPSLPPSGRDLVAFSRLPSGPPLSTRGAMRRFTSPTLGNTGVRCPSPPPWDRCRSPEPASGWESLHGGVAIAGGLPWHSCVCVCACVCVLVVCSPTSQTSRLTLHRRMCSVSSPSSFCICCPIPLIGL
mmetsp:Transcript_37287/g.61218  ORF Transcript_37287/g.61218 Transcript_37287/m.61218 type:complete len:258 (-) Transcript_37287:13-786(-)